jgi:Protein of unknown function (DUF3991)/Toprim-like
MSFQDAELDEMRSRVSCAVLLERHSSPWRLDKKESTRNCLKYRRAAGEILLVTHEGRGWWDPTSTAKGDIFGLVQFLNPGLNFGEVRKILRPYIGVSPAFPIHEHLSAKPVPDVPFAVKWERRRLPRPGSPAWRYLTETRHLSALVVSAAISAGMLREGPHGSAWFAHRDNEGCLTGFEMRGPDYRGFSPGGEKTLFRLPGLARTGAVPVKRLMVAEAPIDAMSVAAIEQLRGDTLYAATAGGMGPGTIAALEWKLRIIATQEGGELVIATDNDSAGHGYADRLTEMARALVLTVSRLLPASGAKDWNEVLRQGRRI